MTIIAEFLANGSALRIEAGEDVAAKDGVQLGPDNVLYKIDGTETAAVASSGDLSDATKGLIKAQQTLAGTTPGGWGEGYARRAALIKTEAGNIFACSPVDNVTSGLVLHKLTPGGNLLASLVVSPGTVMSFVQLARLSNGNILVSCDAGVAIYQEDLTVVKALGSAPAITFSTGGATCVVALQDGGYAFVSDDTGTPDKLRMRTATNAGAVVLGTTEISVVGGGGFTEAVELSDGHLLVVTRNAGGVRYGIFNVTTGAAIKPMTAAAFGTAGITCSPEVSVLPGFFAILDGGDGGHVRGAVYDNDGDQVGAVCSVASTAATTPNSFKLVNNGADKFFAIFATSDSNMAVSMWTTAGDITTRDLGGAKMIDLDAFYERERIAVVGRGTGLRPRLTVIDARALSTLVAQFNFGSASVVTLGGGRIAVLANGDFSFVCCWDQSNTAGVFMLVGKYQSTAVKGVVKQGAAKGQIATVLNGAGTYRINTIGGLNGRAYDHTAAATFVGAKGELLRNNLVIK